MNRSIDLIARRHIARAVCLGALVLGPIATAQPKPGGKEGASAAPQLQEELVNKALQKRRSFAKLRDILKAEPSARQVQDATLRFYKLEPDRIAKMSRNANLKGLIPELEASMDNTVGNNYKNMRDGLYPMLPATPQNPEAFKELERTTSDQFVWRLRAVWNFDRLVFNAEELDVRSLNSIEENLVREVTTLYYSRRRLLANIILSPPEDEEELFYEQLRLDEMTSTLDALSGGMFGAKAWKGDLIP